MPSPVAHTLGAYAGLLYLNPAYLESPRSNRIALALAAVFGCMADADFVVAQHTSNPQFQHHYFSHSFPFAFALGLICYGLLRLIHSKHTAKAAFLITAAYCTHLFLDYFTEDGSRPYGIPLLWPFTQRHFVAPVIIFYSIHRGDWEDLFSRHNLIAICIEVLVLAPLVVLAIWRARRITSRQKSYRRVC
jgi:membrane-bound metal-dependent hydrolase YbcI (DUF457 family)